MENPFAVPAPLFSRKRKAPAAAISSPAEDAALEPFIREESYHTYSIGGHEREAAAVQNELATRTAVRAALALHSRERANTAATMNASSAPQSDVMSIQPVATALHGSVSSAPAKPVRHLAAMLLERAERERSREMVQVINVARRLSALSIGDHEEFMRLHRKRTAALAGGIPAVLALTAEEHSKWGELEKTARQEQSAFSLDLERLAKKERLSEYTFVPPHVEQLFEHRLQSCRNQVMHLYPRYYESQLVVRLHGSTISPAERSASTMKHVQEVASEGALSVLPTALLKQELNLDPRVSGLDLHADEIWSTAGSWKAISADPTAERLMEAHECDVTMSSSTLLAIFDTDANSSDAESMGWVIPVKSRVCMVKGTPRRHLYLDRPLINAHVSAREKIATASRPLATSALTGSCAGRVSYHVWQMGDIKILLRTNAQTSIVPDPASPKASKPASVFIKPDHKPLGIDEQITPSEFRRLWLHSWMRGGSTIVLGRLAPKSSVVQTWSTYTLPKLLQSLGSPGFPDAFEPLDYFATLRTVLVSLQNLPAANFLLRSIARHDAKKHERELEILRAATETTQDESHDYQLDLFQQVNTCGRTSTALTGYVLPTCPPNPDRIPYTYRTGVHCADFLVRGVCEREGSGEVCERMHLRLMSVKNETRWVFEDFSLTPAARRTKARLEVVGGRKKYPQLAPRFPFCCGRKGASVAKLLAAAHEPILCTDPLKCGDPHLSLHAIAERVADVELRAAREKRRTHKSRSRARGRDQHPPSNRDEYNDQGWAF